MPVRPIDIRPYPHRVREDKHEHPGHDRFAALADAALAEIPAPFRNFLGPVPIQIMDFPTDEMLVNLGTVQIYFSCIRCAVLEGGMDMTIFKSMIFYM